MTKTKARKPGRNRTFSNINHNDIVLESHTTVKLKTSKIAKLLCLIKNKRLTDSLVMLNKVGIPNELGLLIISLLQRAIKTGRVTV